MADKKKIAVGDLPWLRPEAIEMMERFLRPEHVTAEFGIGGSTVWFARRVRKHYAVEHQPVWIKLVSDKLVDEHLGNVELMLRPLPYEYALDGVSGSFDMVMVDGRRRVECIGAVTQMIRPGGMLVLDNAERDRYASVFDLLKGWSATTFGPKWWKTTLWVKKES